MRYGRSVPKGSIMVMSVDSEEEAEALLTLACQRTMDGEYYARELSVDQTLNNLESFALRLHGVHRKHIARRFQ